jgi:hypothetical protein
VQGGGDRLPNAHGIIDPIETIDWTGVYWRRLPGDDGG